MTTWIQRITLFAALITLFTLRQPAGDAQQKVATQTDEIQFAKPGTRFEFQVVESFNAKYLGDTPGHIGHAGGLGSTRPHVALGDPVFRGEEIVGAVTSVLWTNSRGSLTIEFDPAPLVRISVGDIVAVDLNPAAAAIKKE